MTIPTSDGASYRDMSKGPTVAPPTQPRQAHQQGMSVLCAHNLGSGSNSRRSRRRRGGSGVDLTND